MSLELSLISTLISFWKFLIGFLSGFLFEIIRKSEPFTDPFILEVFIYNEPYGAGYLPIGFKVKNTTQHSLKTDIAITPIVNDGKYGTIKYYIVINPDGEYVVERIEGEYKNIKHIHDIHNLNAESYKRQLLKFELHAHFRNSRFKVFKIHNSTKIIAAYEPTSRTFRRIE